MTYLPKVSIIVPVYNADQTVEECIRSLLALNYLKENLELIFVDNASTDKTPDILGRYGNEIDILYETKRGPAAARNKGLLSAKGDVVAFTDSDCVVDKDWLKTIVSPLRDPLVGIVGGKILARPEGNATEKFGEQIHDHDNAINSYQPPYVITMNWSSRLSVLRELNLFDEDLIRCEDADLSHRILQSGYRFVFEPEAIIYHRNESTLSGLFREGCQHGFYSVQVIKKHRAFIKDFGHSRFNGRSYAAIVTSLVDYLKGENRNHSICYFVFNSGKKIGKILGSLRFLYVDL